MDRVAKRVMIVGKSPGLESSSVAFKPEALVRNEWFAPDCEAQKLDTASFSGVLEAVDVRTSRYRIRDVAGNDLTLTHVPRQYARLVDSTVTASGEMRVDSNKRAMDMPIITAADSPDWLMPDDQAETDFWSAAAASHPFGSARWALLEPLTDDESDAFWEAINAQ